VLQGKGGKSVFHRQAAPILRPGASADDPRAEPFGTNPRWRPQYRWLAPYGAARFIATHRELTALAFLDSSTEIAEVFQEDAATVLATAKVMLDNPVGILDDLHNLQGCLPRAIIHRIEDLVQLAGEMILDTIIAVVKSRSLRPVVLKIRSRPSFRSEPRTAATCP